MKKILMMSACLLASTMAWAQTEDVEIPVPQPGSGSSFAISIGPKISGVMTTMTQPDQSDLYDGSGFGFSGGVAAQIRFGRATPESAGGTGLFGLGLELKYKQNQVKTIGTDQDGKENAKLQIDYFEVPVYAQIYPFAKSTSMGGLNSLYIEVGASFAGTMSRKPESLTVTREDNSNVTYNLDTDGSKLKGMDIRPLVGLGYTIPKTGLNFNARYYLGGSKLAENFNSKMNSFEFSLAWMFNTNRSK